MEEELQKALLRLVRYKFAGYPNVALMADDILHTAYMNLKSSKKYSPDKENYGYLSVACIRTAYRYFMAQASEFQNFSIDAEGTSLIDETDIVNGVIIIRGKKLPVVNLPKLLGTVSDKQKYVVLQTPWAEESAEYAVAVDEFVSLFYSPIGTPVTPPADTPALEYIREYRESENETQFLFMDWPKMV